MTGFAGLTAKAWCLALSKTTPFDRIPRGTTPYLTRYYLAGWSPTNRRSGPAVFLHHFVASDASDQVHSHPWGWSASLILVGGYREQRCAGHGETIIREYNPGDVNVLQAHDKHRIDLIGAECWTLFLAGSYQQPWGFAPQC